MQATEVRLDRATGSGVATLTLCRPKKLNALSLPLIHELTRAYAELVEAGAGCVVLDGEGRALCAGGDVAELRESVLEGTRACADFFYDEYALDYYIATLPERGVTQVSLWDGIVMGGGVGLSAHSPIRIATERTLFAMPETGIGLFPDVGMTWGLSQLKAGPHVGAYLGLTGRRLKAADCLAAGLATHYVPSERLGQLQERLGALAPRALGDTEAVAAVVAELGGAAEPDASQAVIKANAAAIEHCFGGDPTAEQILERLDAEAGHWLFQQQAGEEASSWAAETADAIRKASPLSVKLSLEAIRRHRRGSLKEAFVSEYRVVQRCMRPQPGSDFCEGIRALLVDKDGAPRWQPSSLEAVTQDQIDEFFLPLGPEHPRGELAL